MGTLNRFKAKNGVDNNSQTITNVANPVNAQDAATKSFASNATNLTTGTLAALHLPAFSGDATTVAGASAITLASVGTAGTYTKVTTDAKGRVTSGTTLAASDIPALDWSKITTSKPTTLAGYGITDGALASAYLPLGGGTLTNKLTSNVGDAIRVYETQNAAASNAIQFYIQHNFSHVDIGNARGNLNIAGAVLTGTPTAPTAAALTNTTQIATTAFVTGAIATAVAGNVSSATKLATGRTLTITGDVSYVSPTFDGSANVTAAATLSTTGVGAGSYHVVTVDTKGRVTAGSNPTTLAGHGITDAYTKTEVDGLITGLDFKQSVRAATTANITLSAPQTIDGVAVVAGDRVLVKNQTTAAQNGIYVVAAGAWTRATDAENGTEVSTGMYVFVEQGTVNSDSGWVMNTDGAITVGTTALSFIQFNGLGQVTTGTGITKTGNQLALASGVATVGTYNSVTVDTYGRITAGTSNAYLTANQTITASGDATGSGTTAIALTLASVGTAGTYTKVTTDAKGRVTAGTTLAAADIPALDWTKITTGKPTTLAGYGITDAPLMNTSTLGYLALTTNTNNSIAVIGATGGDFGLEARGNGTGPALMTFHRPGVHAMYLGLDTDNVLKVGGWSMGAVAYPVLHTNNIASYALPLTGGVISGDLTVSAQPLTQGQFIAVAGSASTWYNSMLRNDGANTYLLSSAVQTTQAAANTATYNTFRPLSWNMSTGAVTIDGTGAGAYFGGQVSIAGGLASVVNPTTAKDGDIKIAAGPIISIYATGAWRQIFPAVYS